jgi:hypothetical protein
MIWLGKRRGYLSDYVTQLWVRSTGRRVRLSEQPWLQGPAGNTRLIGKEFFTDYAKEHGLDVIRSGTRGLIRDFEELSGPSNDLSAVATPVRHFYERTSDYELDAWSEWHGPFKPFGTLLALIFSRRLQQMNVPLSSLDTSKGMTSDVVQLRDPRTGKVVLTAWIRELVGTHNIIYAGSYSICTVPGNASPCVKVVFPLPNGNAIVIMKAEAHADGSLSVTSSGNRFGDPGFYFTVHNGCDLARARYVRTMRETIHVYQDGAGVVRGDHALRLWGVQFLQLHYRLRKLDSGVEWNRERSSLEVSKHAPPS